MADIFSRKKRSAVMAAIRGSGKRATELRLVALLRAHGLGVPAPFGNRRPAPLTTLAAPLISATIQSYR